jgi:hypothetical protein
MQSEPGEAFRQLQGAIDKIHEAQTEQLRASGQGEAAVAAEFAQQVAEAAGLQSRANQAAGDVARGKANTPLEAATRQQEAGERAAELAKQTEGDAAEQLDRASAAAAKAARETLSGDPNRAKAAREAATDALSQALEAARHAADNAAQSPPGQPDTEAQERVGQLAGQAAQLSESAAPSAAESLGAAQQQSQAAKEAIAEINADATNIAQVATGEALAKATEQLKNAAEQMVAEMASAVERQGRQAAELAKGAAQVSPDAATALRAAEQAAQATVPDASQPASASPSEPFDTGQEIQRSFERAAASLAARQQQIQRDRDTAAAIADLAEQQQTAREEIAQQAEALAEMGPLPKPTGQQSGPSPEQISAAEALQRAREQFAQAQRATGQGAVEISRQQQVANVPLREGLEAASQLAMGLPHEAMVDLPMADVPPGGEPEQAAAQAPAPQPGQSQAAELGTGLVPSSPEVTAAQIAGPQAVARAEQTLAMAQAQTPGQTTSSAAGPSQQPGSSSPMASAGGLAAACSPAVNQPVPVQPEPQGDSRSADDETDTEVKMRTFREEPWFAKLPPSLRKAIEARARRRAPRGYEERLRRYFESLE